jgi:hypothetical protein
MDRCTNHSRSKNFVLTIAVALAFGACAAIHHNTPPGPPESQNSAAVGIQVSVYPPLTIMGQIPITEVIFSRMDPARPIPEQSDLVRSPFGVDDRRYVVNIPPGKYALVAVGTDRAMAFLPKSAIDMTTFEVLPGKFVYAGTYELHTLTGGMGEADSAQLQFVRLIHPTTNLAEVLFGGPQPANCELISGRRGKADETALLTQAENDLTDTGYAFRPVPFATAQVSVVSSHQESDWTRLVQNRIAELGANATPGSEPTKPNN